MYRVTLVAPQQLDNNELEGQANRLNLHSVIRLDDHAISGLRDNAPTHAERDATPAPIDILWRHADAPRPRLFLSDMDATMVTQETIDEFAARAGLGDAVKAITDKAKTGQMEFKEALRARVALFAGTPVSLIEDVKRDMWIMKGAGPLLRSLKANDVTTVLVTGGFTEFTSYIAGRLGFDHYVCNTFEIENGVLTGRLIGDIVDRAAKADALRDYSRKIGCSVEEAITIGDGANDIDMLVAAGLGIGFQPKDAVRTAVDRLIIHGDLSTLLYALGNDFLSA